MSVPIEANQAPIKIGPLHNSFLFNRKGVRYPQLGFRQRLLDGRSKSNPLSHINRFYNNDNELLCKETLTRVKGKSVK